MFGTGAQPELSELRSDAQGGALCHLMPQFRLIFTFCSPTMVARSFDGTD